MGLHRQGGGTMPPMSNGDHKISGSLRSAAAAAHRISDHDSTDQEEIGLFRPYQAATFLSGLGRSQFKAGRGKKLSRIARGRQCSVGIFVVSLFCVVIFTILGSDYLLSFGRAFAGLQDVSTSAEYSNEQEAGFLWVNRQTDRKRLHETDGGNRGKGKTNVNMDGVHFGRTVDHSEGHGDSRYWDSDDRKREMADGMHENEASRLPRDTQKIIRGNVHLENWDLDDRMREGAHVKPEAGSGNPKYGKGRREMSKVFGKAPSKFSETGNLESSSRSRRNNVNMDDMRRRYDQAHGNKIKVEDDTLKDPGLYNERGRKELMIYEQKFEAGLDSHSNDDAKSLKIADRADRDDGGYEVADEDDEGEGVFTSRTDTNGLPKEEKLHAREEQTNGEQHELAHGAGQVAVSDKLKEIGNSDTSYQFHQVVNENASLNTTLDVLLDGNGKVAVHPRMFMDSDFQRGIEVRLPAPLDTSDDSIGRVFKSPRDGSMRDPKISLSGRRRRHSGVACKINFLNSTVGLKEHDLSRSFLNFSLNYVNREERPLGNNEWKPRFGGHQTLQDRERSFQAGDNTLHCGFVQGPKGSPSTGFDLSENDTKYLSTCQVAVSSCIFGNSDYIRSPEHKKISAASKEVCFVMFVDQKSLDVMIGEGQASIENEYVGLWKLVLVKNPPYADARRTGKVPKFLAHRLFPSARYSIWIDSKLRLLSDPLLILEHFLWRGGHEYAISNHYDRHCVSEEVQQNKKLNKFNHSVIDEQYTFYQQDGLELFNASDPNRLLPSYVPEGSFIIRAHTPMSNLFSCLWFNEVDRFTPRDQLSFAYTYLKLVRSNPGKRFHLHMIKDCERKAMAKLFRHKQEKLL